MPKTAMIIKVESVPICHQVVVSKVHTREVVVRAAVIHLEEVVVAHIKTLTTIRTDRMNIINISMEIEDRINIKRVQPILLVARVQVHNNPHKK